MPELPEVEVARRNLAAWSSGHHVEDVVLPDPACVRTQEVSSPSAAHPEALDWLRGFVGHPVEGLSRHGKRMAWRIGDLAALHHLGMTGRWVRRSATSRPPRHGRLGLVMSSGETLWFVDRRRFGWVDPSPQRSSRRCGALAVPMRSWRRPRASNSPLAVRRARRSRPRCWIRRGLRGSATSMWSMRCGARGFTPCDLAASSRPPSGNAAPRQSRNSWRTRSLTRRRKRSFTSAMAAGKTPSRCTGEKVSHALHVGR